MEQGKVCTKCGEWKEATTEFFQKEKKGKYGLKSSCRECKNKEMREKRAIGIYPFTCTHCGKGYLAKERKYNKFCSRECFFDNIKKEIVIVTCGECGHAFNDRKTCPKCEKNKHKKIMEDKLKKELVKQEKDKRKEIIKQEKEKEKIKKCGTCGEMFIGNSSVSVYCSDKCRKKASNRKSEIQKGIRGKRIKENGRIDHDISLEKLAKRDNDFCYLCNRKVDWNDFEITQNGAFKVGRSYPSIDHVVAVVNGGTHTWNNVKLAHCQCNSVKSDNEEYISNKMVAL